MTIFSFDKGEEISTHAAGGDAVGCFLLIVTQESGERNGDE